MKNYDWFMLALSTRCQHSQFVRRHAGMFIMLTPVRAVTGHDESWTLFHFWRHRL